MFLTFKADDGSALYVSEDLAGDLLLEKFVADGEGETVRAWAETLNRTQTAELHAYLGSVVKR